jgi:hypothetical protein
MDISGVGRSDGDAMNGPLDATKAAPERQKPRPARRKW